MVHGCDVCSVRSSRLEASVASAVDWPSPTPSRCAGITLSQKQVERGTELAKERNIPNASFQVREPHTQSGESQACDRGIDGCDLTCTALCCVC